MITSVLSLIAYKMPHGEWAFDHPHQNTLEEALCNGTELIIDYYYQKLNDSQPLNGDEIKIELQLEPFKGLNTKSKVIDTRLNIIEKGELGTTYTDLKTQMVAWLCPWLQGYFGFIPEVIYARVSSCSY